MLCVCCCCCYTLDSFYSFIRFPSTTSSPEYKIDTCFTHILCFGFSFLYHRLEREKEMKFSCFSPIQCDTHFTSLSTVAAHLCVFLFRSARFFYVSRSTVLIFRIVLVHPFFFHSLLLHQIISIRKIQSRTTSLSICVCLRCAAIFLLHLQCSYNIFNAI